MHWGWDGDCHVCPERLRQVVYFHPEKSLKTGWSCAVRAEPIEENHPIKNPGLLAFVFF